MSLEARGGAATSRRASQIDRLGARHHARRHREVSVVGKLGLAVDVAQNTAAGYPNIPSNNTTAAGRE